MMSGIAKRHVSFLNEALLVAKSALGPHGANPLHIYMHTTTMAFPGLLEGQRNQPKPHVDLFSEVMVRNTFDPLMPLTKTPDEDS